MTEKNTAKRFIAAGALLFLLGLMTGFAIPAFRNPRMGVASHLEGVTNGTFLIALGAAWGYVSLSRRGETATFWLLAYGSFANWLFVTVAAVFGTSKMTPIAGAGYEASAWQENIVSGGLLSVGVTMLLGCLLVAYGAFRSRNDSADARAAEA